MDKVNKLFFLELVYRGIIFLSLRKIVEIITSLVLLCIYFFEREKCRESSSPILRYVKEILISYNSG